MLIVAMSKIKLMKISRPRQQNIKSSTGLCSWSHVHETGSGPLTSRKHGDSCSPCGPAVFAPTALVAAAYYLVLYLGFHLVLTSAYSWAFMAPSLNFFYFLLLMPTDPFSPHCHLNYCKREAQIVLFWVSCQPTPWMGQRGWGGRWEQGEEEERNEGT